MKKIKILLMSFAILLVGVWLVSCSNETQKKLVLNDTLSVYGFEAMSSVVLLDDMSTANSLSLAMNNPTRSSIVRLGANNNEVTEAQIEQINNYLLIMEQMLAEDKPLTITNEESDREGFENKMVIVTKDIAKNQIQYTMYYNEIAINEEEAEENIDEVESSLTGIMIINDTEYEVFGEKKQEEDELEIQFTAKIDNHNWVKVKQEIQKEETEFKYTISNNGHISMSKIQLEKTNNKTSIKLTFINNGLENKYMFKEEVEEDMRIIKIKCLDENISANIKVFIITDSETGEVSYEYKYVETGKTYIKDGRNKKKNPID